MPSDEEVTRYVPKKDQYARSRGAAQFLDLFCANCHAHLALYQKDGPGALLRLYLDRIFAPLPQSNWQTLGSFTEVPNLTCANCDTLIGVPMIYLRENRPAIRLIRGTFSKVRSNGTYPPIPATEK